MKGKELRMYGLVNYQLSGIQKGIQFGHAVVEYGLENFHDPIYQEWAKNWKTFIILNGGTTNTNFERPGTLNEHRQNLFDNNINFSSFFEPDLGDQLTSVVFIVDERVFKKDDYPDFMIFTKDKIDRIKWLKYFKNDEQVEFDQEMTDLFDQWTEMMGGEKNVFLREFLKQFRLA